jgi:DNA polymerase III subunit epsilon
MDFVAIDFETAIGHHICSVGIVTFEGGKVIEEFHALIQPPDNNYNWHNIQVHGITEEDTVNSPNFKGVYPDIEKRLKGRKVVAHNESFDRRVLSQTMSDFGIEYSTLDIPVKWECTLKIFKSKGYKPANLKACCDVHNIELNHHEALSDARACGQLYVIANT